MNDRVIRDLDAPVAEIAKSLAEDPRAGITPRQLLAQYDAETAADVNTLARTLEGAFGNDVREAGSRTAVEAARRRGFLAGPGK